MRLSTRALPLIAAVVVGTTAVAGCAGTPDRQAASTTTMTSTAAPTTAASPTAPTNSADATTTVPRVAATSDEVHETAPYSMERVQHWPAEATELVVSDVRVGSHDGFDRVVVEYSGTGTPGFTAGYVDQARQQASGYPLEVAGPAHLEVMIHGTPMGMLSPREELIQVGPMNLASGAIQGVTHGGVFEADTQYVIGLDKKRPFRVYTLSNPARVVIDIQQ
ncbi:hypothetical protein [Corynebacterium sp.]|uniref:AMIN-like domain-containing (lipo)protein n=1 Tax=Corynebacterium sp. TaxID=1720 RepID=UPI002A913EAE|nr:hypothetical protein [Corynebacterium sp.]MDY5785184.1 hypothetical protein [Corynebacterium sp.]